MGRAPCCDKANVKKGPWSPEEDMKLKEFIENYGTGGNWIALPQKAGLKRCGKSCRLRWLNYLRPDIKHGEFSDEDDRVICSLFACIGSRWSIIASHLPGRTDNDIKNYWNTKLKKKLLGISPTQIRKPHHEDEQLLKHHNLLLSSSSSSYSSSFLSSPVPMMNNPSDLAASSMIPPHDQYYQMNNIAENDIQQSLFMVGSGSDQRSCNRMIRYCYGGRGTARSGELLGSEDYLYGGADQLGASAGGDSGGTGVPPGYSYDDQIRFISCNFAGCNNLQDNNTL